VVSPAETTIPPTAAPVQVPLANNAVALAKLPLATPLSGAFQFDRFTAFIVGAILLLLARKPVEWLIKVFRP
jgi:hypothetical protein